MVKEETKKRLQKLKDTLKERDLEVALIFSPLNIFYFTGLWIKGALLVTPDKHLLLVKRPMDLGKGLKTHPFRPLKGFREIPLLLEELSFKRLALEYGAFNLLEGETIKGYFSDFSVKPLDEILWELRMIKSSREIAYQRRAGQILGRALKKSLRGFRPGQREIYSSALLEGNLRRLGHPGYTRSFNNFELTYGYLLSGKEGLYPIAYTTGEGGKGVPGFPGGASYKRLKEKEPILIDFSGYYNGYYVDQTRMASFGRVKDAEPFYRASLEILETLEKEAVPGRSCAEIFEIALDIVKNWGFDRYFMYHGEPLAFVGHGVGLQIDEPPVISPKSKVALKENMVIALEPKFHVRELGVIGLEDTFQVTAKGLRRLTTFSRDWIYL
ncbi:MAG: Xaa-Pro peptidase family protein [Caldimicrobium sp.]|nr:Xaa-Pro peptidase family protein [Caldimicrobium sp.]MCX7873675.1 Xaa-Pro peptidase family protein [Caldimicrobium sp.]MDW8094641.1 Xaa-Pro peptidase family protein [Caldimicrobium sp.]